MLASAMSVGEDSVKKKGGFSDGTLLAAMLIGIAGGCVAGFVIGWLWRDRPGAIANVSLLSVLTVFGTVAAAGVAGWLGLREGRIRLQDRRRREAYAKSALWPEFRRYLAAIERLQRKPEKREVDMVELIRRLQIEGWVRELVRDLPDKEFESASNVIAQLHHAHRHLSDILYVKLEYPKGDRAKVLSVTNALHIARREMVPLIRIWRKN